MKKLILLGLIISSMFSEEKFKLPMDRDTLSIDRGGLLDTLKSYSDGIGLYVISPSGEKEIDNSIQNELVYKYGEIAQLHGVSIRQQIMLYESNKEVRDKSKDIYKYSRATNWNDSQACNDNNEFTKDDRFWNRICEGIYPKSCKEIKELYPTAKNDYYFIDPDTKKGKVEPFKVYCDLDNGGWTKINYTKNVEFNNHWINGDKRRYLDKDFEMELSSEQITAIAANSTEGKQIIDFNCQNVLSFYNPKQKTYNNALGFKFFNNIDLNYKYLPDGIIINKKDECSFNDNKTRNSIFEIKSKNLPIKNISTLDNGESNEKFGIDLINNPAWLK